MPSRQCGQCPSTGHHDVVDNRWLRPLLPRRLRAYVRSPEEIQMAARSTVGSFSTPVRFRNCLASRRGRFFGRMTALASPRRSLSHRGNRSVREWSSSTRESAARSRAHHRGQVSRTPSGSSETSSCIRTGTTRQGTRVAIDHRRHKPDRGSRLRAMPPESSRR
jgi:hypothetical protein